jgi:ADP-heptose:LPS heptosyltransferase
MPAGPFPILFFAPADPIEAIFASGLFKRLHDEVDNASFTVVTSSAAAPLFREAPKREVTLLRDRKGSRSDTALLLQLRKRRWGLVLDAVGTRLAGLVSAKRRARPKADDESGAVHKVVAFAKLLKLEEDLPAPYLFVSERTRERARELIGEGGPLLAMAPGAPWIGQAWPPERFARTAAHLMGEGGLLSDSRMLIVDAPEDGQATETLRRSIARDRVIDLTGQSDLLLVHACLQSARLFVGGACLHTHLAAASGIGTIALFGPNDEALERPWGDNVRVVRGPRSFQAIRATDPHLDQPVCHMLDLPVEQVAEAAVQLLEENAPPKTGKRRHG